MKQNNLNMYVYVVRTGDNKDDDVSIPENINVVVALSNNNMKVINDIQKSYSGKVNKIHMKEQAIIPFQKLLDGIKEETGEDMNKKQFTNNLILASDKFVKNKRDQASIKRILRKIDTIKL